MPTEPGSGVLLVLDTNTALSGLLWGGVPGSLVDAALAGQTRLISSPALLAELQGVLSRQKFAAQLSRRGLAVADVFGGYAAMVVVVAPAAITPTVLRDPADDHVLAAALAAQVDFIVSGDSDLLDLKSFQGIPIITARDALERLRALADQ
jgi:putative PIN family toxin of toxin-antitoxin system